MATKKVGLGPSSFLTIRRMLPASKMPLAELPPRDSRFGSPLQLSKVHWVKPELVVEVTYRT